MLKLQNIYYAYQSSDFVLNNLTLLLKNNQIYALMGANGSGKTTLFNVITGYLSTKSGSILFKGTNISGKKPHKINVCGIGRTFQDMRLITRLTVAENVMLAMKGNPTDGILKGVLPGELFKSQLGEMKERADIILQEYFLSEVKDSPAGEISYGQQKLLNLACCVANNAELLLLDEPLAGINDINRELIEKKICDLSKEGKTILMIDHHMDFIERAADEVFFLQDGRVKRFPTVKEMTHDEEVRKTYLI